jgi:hypothetical protein
MDIKKCNRKDKKIDHQPTQLMYVCSIIEEQDWERR